jgi:uncharacterized protein YggT (Ycf19 family)
MSGLTQLSAQRMKVQVSQMVMAIGAQMMSPVRKLFRSLTPNGGLCGISVMRRPHIHPQRL